MKMAARLRLGIIATTAALPALNAQAASTAQADSNKLEEVIVTAEKVTKDLQKTSIAIDVFNGEKMAEEGRHRMDDVLRGVPGVQMQPDGVSMAFTIRGFSGGGIAPSPNGVAVMVDGVTQTTPTANQMMRGTMLDTSQVELARGTQNTNIGASSLAGSFTVVSNKPTFDYEAKGSLEVGNFHLREMQGVLNMPISDRQAIRLAYSSNRRDGYISSNAGESDQSNFRLRYRFRQSDDLDMVFTFFKQELGGNPTDQNLLLATGHWVPFSGQQSITVNGVTYPTNPSTSPIFQNAQTYTFAAGSVLAPGAVPLPATAATNYAQLCTPLGALFNTGNTTAPFITSMGCPATFIAVRDNIPWYQRSNPWNDGLPFRGYNNYPHRETYVTTYAADITWKTHIGTWTFTPSFQDGKMYAVASPSGTGWTANDELNPNYQFELRLASNPDSKVSWLAGVFASYDRQPEQYNYNVVYPTTANLPTLSRPGGTSTANALTYVLPVAAGGPTTLAANQAYATGQSACYVFNAGYCYTQNGRNSSNITNTSASTYLNMTWPLLENRMRALTGIRIQSNLQRTVGRGGGLWLTDANQSIAVDGLTYFTGTIPAGAASLNCGTATAANPCAVNFVSQKRPDTLLKYGWNGDVSYFNGVSTTYAKASRFDVQYRLGLEYDLKPGVMVYGAYATAKRPSTFDTTTLILAKPLSLAQTTLGMKSRWFDDRLQVNVEGFNSKYINRAASAVYGSLYSQTAGATTFSCPAPALGIVATAVVGATGTSADTCFNRPLTASSTADMLSRGVDMDVTWQLSPTDRMTLSAEFLESKSTAIRGVDHLTAADVLNYAALNTAFVSPNPGTAAQQTASAQAIADNFNADLEGAPGATLQESPRWTSSFSYQHAFLFKGGSQLTPRVDMRYSSAYWSRQQNQNIRATRVALATGNFEPSVQKAFTKWNLYATWDSADDKWSVSGYVNNVTNKAILLNTSASTGAGQTVQANNLQITGGAVTLDAPRTYGLIMSAKF